MPRAKRATGYVEQSDRTPATERGRQRGIFKNCMINYMAHAYDTSLLETMDILLSISVAMASIYGWSCTHAMLTTPSGREAVYGVPERLRLPS